MRARSDLAYYSTAATVIPLLLLAVVVELRTFGTTLPRRPNWRFRWLAIIGTTFTMAFVSEVVAFNVLARGYAKSHDQTNVGSGLTAIAVAAAIGLILRVVGVGESDHPDARRGIAVLLIVVVAVLVTMSLVLPGFPLVGIA